MVPLEDAKMSNYFHNGYALFIGVEVYKDKLITNLPATFNDVTELRKVLTDPTKCGYKRENVKSLIGVEATNKDILDSLDWLIENAENDPEATILFYYSGHGWKSEDSKLPKYYLIPYDCAVDNISGTAISDEVLSTKLDQISSERLVVLIDSCHAGGTTKDVEPLPPGFSKATIPPSKIYEIFHSGSGRVVISSSRENERSYLREPDLDHSIFTVHLLEALLGKAHTYNQGKIGIIDVFTYLAAKVPETVKTSVDPFTSGPAQQHPIMDGSKVDNFTIALAPIIMEQSNSKERSNLDFALRVVACLQEIEGMERKEVRESLFKFGFFRPEYLPLLRNRSEDERVELSTIVKIGLDTEKLDVILDNANQLTNSKSVQRQLKILKDEYNPRK